MKKVSKKELDRLQKRGKTVTSKDRKPTPSRIENKAEKQPVAQASMAAVIMKVQADNLKVIKAFGEDVRKIVGRKRSLGSLQ
jgi:hypothetical protein